MLDHGGVGGGDEIKVQRLVGLHEESGSLKVKSKATTLGAAHVRRRTKGRF
jgi:hypothetical protein